MSMWSKGRKLIGVRILHLHGPEQLKQAGWGSILEMQAGVYMYSWEFSGYIWELYMKAIGSFPHLILWCQQLPIQQSTTLSGWDLCTYTRALLN